MNTKLSFSKPAEIETDCLAVVVLDHGEGSKNEPRVLGADEALKSAAADLISSGEVSGKIFETALLHAPRGLKAKRLLLIGGGKAKNFSAYELRKMAGTAVRFLKPKDVRSFAFLAPASWSDSSDQSAHSTRVAQRDGTTEAVSAVVEGAFVGNFDPNTYQSERKDQRIRELTVIAAANGDQH
jgi:leucyl aminopeptidase